MLLNALRGSNPARLPIRNGGIMGAPRFSPYQSWVLDASSGVSQTPTDSANVSHRLEHDARIDTAKPEGVAKDIAKRLFARLVCHHIEVTSRIRRFKI